MRRAVTTGFYTLSLHDALPIFDWKVLGFSVTVAIATGVLAGLAPLWQAIRTAPNAVLSEGVRASAAAPARRLSKDRKSTRLNSSHPSISYAAFCLNKNTTSAYA